MITSDIIDFGEKRNLQLVTIVLVVAVGYVMFSYTASLFAFISPSSELRWETSVKDYGQSGGTISFIGVLEEGTQYFQIFTYYYFTSPEASVTWCVTVLREEDSRPIYIDTGTITDAQGNYEVPVSFALTEAGHYKVRIMVWTQLLPNGLTRTRTIHEGSFQVV